METHPENPLAIRALFDVVRGQLITASHVSGKRK
jgi:hypothetical protein